MSDPKKTISVTVEAAIQRVSWTDHKRVDDDFHIGQKTRRPMTKVTEVIRGRVEVEFDFADIVGELARQALHNKGPKASALSGKIRARQLTADVSEKREPSQWAPGGDS